MVFCDSEAIKYSFFYPIKTAILSKSIVYYFAMDDAATIRKNK